MLFRSSASSTSTAGSSPESEDEADDATATPGETAEATSGEPESLRQVPHEEAQAYASEAGLLFFETSAKTGEGVVEIFTEIGTCYNLSFNYVLDDVFYQPRKFLLNIYWLQLVVTRLVLVAVRAHDHREE